MTTTKRPRKTGAQSARAPALKALQAQMKRAMASFKEAFSTCHSFFANHRPEVVPGIETIEHHEWEQGSCWTKWDWEIRAPMRRSGSPELSIRNYSARNMSTDEWLTVRVFRGGAWETVLEITAAEQDPTGLRMLGGWFIKTYQPGRWEKLLSGTALRKLVAPTASQRRAKKPSKFPDASLADITYASRALGL